MGGASEWVGRVLAAALLSLGVGCGGDPAPSGLPAAESPPVSHEVPEAPATVAPPEEELLSPESEDARRALSCEELRPGGLGVERSIVLGANAPEADCGPGTGDGSGSLALLNSGRFGATAWSVVTRGGEDTGKRLQGGEAAIALLPQPRGFHVVRAPPGGTSLSVYSSEGEGLGTVPLTGSAQEPFAVAADPRGGTLIARWAPRADGTQVLTFQVLEAEGSPRMEPVEVLSGPARTDRFVTAGVDTKGRVLLLWPEAGSALWAGQWRKRNGKALTPLFTFPAPTTARGGQLVALAGGGLALRSEGQWRSRFPSGAAEVEPAPAWLASHPGSELILIRGRRANALVPPPTFVAGSGCQESLLFFTRDGTACGELRLPVDAGSTCFQRRPGIAREGTVIQQLTRADNQCAWRWWPRLLK